MNSPLLAVAGLLLAAPVEKTFPGVEGEKWVVRTERAEGPPPHDVHKVFLSRQLHAREGAAAPEQVAAFEDSATSSGLGSFRHEYQFHSDADGVFQVDESSIELQNGIKSTQEKSSKVAHRWNGKHFIPGNSQTATAELFKPARGDEWRVNRLPGAAPSATSEQVVLQVMRRTATGFEEVTRLEESLQTEPKTGVKRRTRVEFSIDESGVFQARQTISVKQGPKPEKTEKVMVLKWDGKALTPARGR